MADHVIQVARAEVVIREDVIESPSDPRPNAFFDAKIGILRVYHGPVYGNPLASLVPVKAHQIGAFVTQQSQSTATKSPPRSIRNKDAGAQNGRPPKNEFPSVNGEPRMIITPRPQTRNTQACPRTTCIPRTVTGNRSSDERCSNKNFVKGKADENNHNACDSECEASLSEIITGIELPKPTIGNEDNSYTWNKLGEHSLIDVQSDIGKLDTYQENEISKKTTTPVRESNVPYENKDIHWNFQENSGNHCSTEIKPINTWPYDWGS